MVRQKLLCLVLALVTIMIYLPVLHYSFVNLDDDQYVTSLPYALQKVSLAGFYWAFTNIHFAGWQPLTMLSHMLDCQFFGLNASGHHFTNVILHTANAVLLFLILKEMTGALWRSFSVAALFAWHPLHVESVAWISDRKDLLSTFFVMLTLIAYLRYVRRPQWSSYLAIIICYAFGLMSKATVVTLPFVLLLMDYWPLKRIQRANPTPFQSLRPLLREKLLLFIMAAAFSVVAFWAQQRGGALPSLGKFSLAERAEHALVNYSAYIVKMFWPTNLAVPYPVNSIPVWQWMGSATLLVFGTVAVLRTAQRSPFLFVGWFWYLATLVPVAGFVQVGTQSMADRYTYFPLIGLFVAVAFGVGEWAAKLRLKPIIVISLVGFILVGCLTVTARQLQFWRNSETLFTHSIAVTRGNYVAYNNLGLALMEDGRKDDAKALIQKALQVQPDYADAHSSLGILLLSEGETDQAMFHFQKAVEIQPDDPRIQNNLGTALLRLGQTSEASVHFQKALEIQPENAQAHCNLGVALMQNGRATEAIPHFQKSLEIQPADMETLSDLGTALLQSGQPLQAMPYFQEALKINPRLAQAHDGLGWAFLQNRQIDEAMLQFQEALETQPNYVKAHNGLGLALLQKGRREEAMAHFQRIVEINPKFPQAQRMLGDLLLQSGHADEAMAHYQAVLKIQPQNASVQNNLAWILATSPEASLRNGARAFELAQQADHLTGGNNSTIIGTLAAAYAETGHFSEAVAEAQHGLQLAAAQTNTAQMDALRQQLEYYQHDAPFRDDGLTNIAASRTRP
jgi:protein O-mannosyl-transferase